MKRPPPIAPVHWAKAYRIITTRYPPVALFEQIAEPEDWELLVELESLTNPRIRDSVGQISLVPVEERLSGPGASWVMSCFTHIGRTSRFCDGTFGVYYAAHSVRCAVAETAYHWGLFYAATDEPSCQLDMLLLVGRIWAELHDLRPATARNKRLHDPESYTESQAFAGKLHQLGSNGCVYQSVRLSGDECVAAFRPSVVGIPSAQTNLLYHWNGKSIDRYFDYSSNRWIGTD